MKMERKRKGSWYQTFIGQKFWPLDPQPEEIHIEDIAHSLSNICRFNGHCKSFYSVANHCVLGAESLYETPELALAFLLHDAAEAYICDMPRPLKYESGMFGKSYLKIEKKLEEAIAIKFGLKLPMPEIIKYTDSRMLLTEKRDLLTNPAEAWKESEGDYPVFEDKILPLSHKSSELAFLTVFEALIKATGRDNANQRRT